jgi:hypothetical protein
MTPRLLFALTLLLLMNATATMRFFRSRRRLQFLQSRDRRFDN